MTSNVKAVTVILSKSRKEHNNHRAIIITQREYVLFLLKSFSFYLSPMPSSTNNLHYQSNL